MKLFHFSDDPAIERFVPRPVHVPAKRCSGQEWLNGPLVWAIDETHEFLYLFSRACPRILIWPTEKTTEADRENWFAGHNARAIAFAEQSWAARIRTSSLYRYELPVETFENLRDAGMWVSRRPVSPLSMDRLARLDGELERRHVKLRLVANLTAFKCLWSTTLHTSGIRLRNAEGWEGR